VRRWALTPTGGGSDPDLLDSDASKIRGLVVDPLGRYLLAGTLEGAKLIPLAGGAPRELSGFKSVVLAVAFSPDGRLAAAGGGKRDKSERVIRIWDLDSGETRTLDAGDGEWVTDLQFIPDGQLISAGGRKLYLWNLKSGDHQLIGKNIVEGELEGCFDSSRDGRTLLINGPRHPTVLDLQSRESRGLKSHGGLVFRVALDPSGTIAATGDTSGIVRVGPVTGEEPHLLLGHEGKITSLAISPDARWIASGGTDGTIRLWPMPEGVPLHTLPYEKFLEKLRSLTNVRVIRDGPDAAGDRFRPDPFPGWETVPTW
jgi:WD40 repeat protein